jgi:8-oxo-dGTP pyrophosphatase MutT (NUDIX family)
LREIGERLAQGEYRVIETGADWQHAAVAVVFREGRTGPELLFIQRASHPNDPWSGQIGFPGGRVETEDEGPLQAARRETMEEIGLDLEPSAGVRSLGALNQVQARAKQEILSMVISPYAFLLDGPAEPPPALALNYEVDAAFWIPLAKLASEDLRIWHHAARATVPYRFRALNVGRAVPLWGLTHRMTMEILEQLGMISDVDALTLPQLKD